MATELRTAVGRIPDRSGADSDRQLIALWLRGRRSIHTREAYARDVAAFLAQAGQPALAAVTVAMVQAWVEELAAALAPSSAARKLAGLKSLLAFAAATGYLPYNVGAAVQGPPVPNRLAERILSERDTLNLLAAAGSARNRVALDLCYYAGLRVSEVCGLQVRDIADLPDGGCVLAVHGKGGRTRHVALPAGPARRLRTLVAHRDPDSPAVRTASGRAMTPHGVRQVVKAAARRAGIAAAPSPHWLRHACASHSLDRGAPVHVVQQTLGHASLATTSRYTHARPGQSAGAYLAG